MPEVKRSGTPSTTSIADISVPGPQSTWSTWTSKQCNAQARACRTSFSLNRKPRATARQQARLSSCAGVQTSDGCLRLARGLAILGCARLLRSLILRRRCAHRPLPVQLCSLILEAAVDAHPQDCRLQKQAVLLKDDQQWGIRCTSNTGFGKRILIRNCGISTKVLQGMSFL